jgi:hypothetical protein
MRKKGQTEIIGLLFIVLLLMGIGLIFIKLSNSNNSNELAEIRSNIETTNLLKALLKVDVEGENIGDMLVECSLNSNCGRARSLIPDIMKTILKPGSSYKFEAVSNGVMFIELGDCEGSGIISNQPYVRQNIFVENRLKLC